MNELPWITTFCPVRRFGNDFYEWRSHEWKSLPNRLTSDKKIVILFTLTNVLFYFLHVIFCHEHTNPLRTIIERSFRHCCQGRPFLTEHCDVTTNDLWRHANAKYWYCEYRYLATRYSRLSVEEIYFLHARPWIPGDEIAIFTAVIHQWRSPLRQFARARTIDEYDVTMLVSYIRVTSQINGGDVTILNQKRLSSATTAKSAIDNCFGGIECSGHQIACKKQNNTFVTVNNDFWVLVMRFAHDFHSWLRHSWKLLANRLTRDPKIVIHGNSCIILYIIEWNVIQSRKRVIVSNLSFLICQELFKSHQIVVDIYFLNPFPAT